MTSWRQDRAAGYTFIELVVATAILMILASAALPLARVSIRRQQEAELRRDLREMRTAIEAFNQHCIDHPAQLLDRTNARNTELLHHRFRITLHPFRARRHVGTARLHRRHDARAGHVSWRFRYVQQFGECDAMRRIEADDAELQILRGTDAHIANTKRS